MHQPWINKSKLAIPAAPPAVLGRSPIPGAPPPVVILAAGPGYGKSVCLRGLATAEAPQGAITLWYGLDPLDADPATFFHYLVAAVQRHIPAFGTEVLALLAGDRQDPRLLWQRWFQDLDAFNLPAVRLVLDDAHRAAATTVGSIVHLVQRGGSASLLVVLAAPLSGLAAQRGWTA